MTARDIRMAVLQECAELAENVSRRYGNLPRYGAGVVASEIRALMAREIDEPSQIPVTTEGEPYL